MEELSREEYARLNPSEREAYLRQLLGDETSSDSESFSDSEDEDGMLQRADRSEYSDNDCGGGDPVEVEVNEDENRQEEEEEEEQEEEEHVQREVDTHGNTNQPSTSAQDHFRAKDGTVWHKIPPIHHQAASHNIVRQRSGPHRTTSTLSMCNTFKCIFTPEIVDIIVRHTNKKARSVYQEFNEKNPTKQPLRWKDLTSTEFYAFLGILLTSGANNSNTDHVFDLFKNNSYPLYRATMGVNRFCRIIRFLRFDDANTREQRLQEDKAAPINEIWMMLNSKLINMYKPTENLTIDEQLFPYRGRTRFTQYIPSKPAKYGIKVWWICDAKNYYPLTGQIYTGKSASGRETNQGERVVKDLAAPYKGSGRNITMDNFFTTLPLAQHLLSWNLTIVGTLKRNKKYIPAEMTETKSRVINSSIFGYYENITICSYVPKKKKTVILLSSMHHDDTTSGPKNKPELIHFYNKTKSGVDIMDKLVGRYSVRRRTNRWPLAFFFNIVDIAALAAYVIYYENNDMLRTKTDRRRVFLRQLGEELCVPIIQDRSLNQQVIRNLSTKLAIESMLNRSIVAAPASTASTSASAASTSAPTALPRRDASGRKIVTGSCYVCHAAEKRRRKTRKSCVHCEKPVCDEHSHTLTVCKNCPLSTKN